MTNTPINHMVELIKYAEAGHPTAQWAREHIANLARQLADITMTARRLETDLASALDAQRRTFDDLEAEREYSAGLQETVNSAWRTLDREVRLDD